MLLPSNLDNLNFIVCQSHHRPTSLKEDTRLLSNHGLNNSNTVLAGVSAVVVAVLVLLQSTPFDSLKS